MKPGLTLAAVCAAVAVGGALGGAADAKTLRWARTSEALTMDPHAQNEGPTTTFLHQIYEPLLNRDHTGAIVPALATGWAPSSSNPEVWVFTLRQGVTFHDGAAFTADDVVFSLNRAMDEESDFKELLSSVKEVRKVDDHTVEIVTNGPNPILPSNLTNMFMMDSGWAAANGVEKPQDFEGGEETYAVRNANGTGPYVLTSREPDSRSVLTLNEGYWGVGAFPLDVTEIVFTPIQNPATRVAALLSGEVDFIQDVPVQDLDRVASTEGLVVATAPQNRVIFFGLNVGADDLTFDDVEGANPFADLRVRQAMHMAINREAIKQVVMRGQSQPAGVIMPPFVNGWTEALDQYPAYDVAAAKALMEEAGYGDGFSVTLNCPNDRYINDEAICQAAVGMMGQIGIDVTLDAKPRAQHFPLINSEPPQTDFYMLGWGVPTYDSEYIFNFLVHSRNEGRGSWNGTGYSNPALDEKIRSLSSNTDLDARNATIAEIWAQVAADRIYLPIHHQVLNWGMSDRVDTQVDPGDQVKFKYVRMGD
jgi:peptide/nickel transport system substrate-binding protein